jgi:hypothetical protein
MRDLVVLFSTSYHSTRMPGPYPFWTATDSRDEAHRVPVRLAHAGLDGRPPESIPRRGQRPHESPLVSLATALLWALSHADGGVRCVRDACGPHVRSGGVSSNRSRSCPCFPKRPCVESGSRVPGCPRVPAAPEWEFATDRRLDDDSGTHHSRHGAVRRRWLALVVRSRRILW